MSEDANKLTCAEFQAQMPELIGSGEDLSTHPHVQSCDLCRELLAELETIAQAARELFPISDPSDELWSKLEKAIETEEKTSAPTASEGLAQA